MPLLDLTRVTAAMTRLVQERVAGNEAWLPRATPTISGRPPDQPGGSAATLYLYHAAEDPHFRNPPPPSPGAVLGENPLGLTLHFQLCAHPPTDDEAGYAEAQLLLGCAMLGLHRTPMLDEAVEVNGVRIFDAVGLAGTRERFRISMLPMPPEEAAGYWTAGSVPLRLAAYYSVTPVVLEGTAPSRSPARVLRHGVSVQVMGAPRLDGSESEMRFTPPGATDEERFTARPAQAAIGDAIVFTGSNLAGEEAELLLRRAGGDPQAADPTWSVSATPTRLHATVAAVLGGAAVLPGAWTAQARVTSRARGADGRLMRRSILSNQTPFTIVPRVSSPAGPDGAGVYSVTGGPFADPLLAADRVEVWIGEAPLDPPPDPPVMPPPAGSFHVMDAATLVFRLPPGVAPGVALPLRIVVDGAESKPSWVTP